LTAEAGWASLRDPLLQRASRDSGRLAYVLGQHELTFGELADRAAVRAGALQRRGVGHGSRVAIVLPTGSPLIETFWAAQILGAVPCILNPEVPQQALNRRLQTVRPEVVVSGENVAALSEIGGSLSVPELTGEDVAVLQLTSGTAGEPRAAMILHRHALAYQRGRQRDGHAVADGVLVNWMPPWHDFGLQSFLIAAVYFGVCCYQLEPRISVMAQWLRTIGEVGGTYTGAPDFAFRVAARMVDPRRVDLSSLRIATNGAEPVRWSTIEQFEERFSVPGVVLPAYGLAETTAGVTAHLRGEDRAVDPRGNVSCGRPIGGIEVQAGTGVDAVEEIRVRGDWVFAGYFDAEADTRERLRDGWLHTGDSGYLDAEGRLFVLGRRSALIKRAGGVIAPRELEEAAQRVPDVRISAATSIRARRDEDDLVLVVEARDGVDAARLRREVSHAVLDALGFAPNRVLVVGPRTIPLSETGKIRYGALQDALRDGVLA